MEKRGAKIRLSRVIDVAVGQTAGSVDQQPADRSETDPSAHRAQPLNPFMGLEECVRIGWWRGEAGEAVYPVVPLDIRALKVSFETEDKPVPLIIVTELATTNEPIRIGMKRRRRKICEGCWIGKRIEIGIRVSPPVPGVAAQVKACPCEITCRSHRRDLLHFFPTVHLRARKGCCAQRRNGKRHPY